MRTIILIVLFTGMVAVGSAQSSSTYLPNWLIDSLAFEVRLGRQCTIALEASQKEIKAQALELIHQGTALRLSHKSNALCDSLLLNAKAGREILGMQFAKDLKQERKKTKRWRNSTFISVAVIVILILNPK